MKKNILLLATICILISCSKNSDSEKLSKIKSLKEERAKIQAALTKIDAQLVALEKKEATETLVTVQILKDTIFSHYIDIQGNVSTKENILIQPEMPGTLAVLNASAGMRVGKGQVLARVDDGGMSQQLASIENQAALAKTVFERQKNLWEQKIGSEIQYLQAKTQMVSTQKSVMQIRSQLEKTVIKAPFSGIIDEVFVERGQVVSPSPQGLMRIVNLSNMYIQASIPESYIGKLKIGSVVNVLLPSIGKQTVGKVRQVGSNINPTNRSFGIEVAVPNNDNLLRPNQVAKLQIIDYKNEKAIVVPTNIIQEDGDKNKFVFVVDKATQNTGIAKKIIVKTGKFGNNTTEIINGLSENNIIVTEGINTISEGSKLNF